MGAYGKVLDLIGEIVDEDEFVSRFNAPISVDLRNAKVPDVPLYLFQEKAVQALEKSFIKDDRGAGLLVMPTGSGKTRTAVYFLLTKMIKEGYQIVWLTHRHMLIEQPAECFYNFSGLVKAQNPGAKSLHMLCVSGKHASIRQAEKKDDIIVLSIQSAVRSLDFLKRALREKVIIVVDEAHHTIADSYRKIINCIRNPLVREAKLLGLTATPVRANEKDTNRLTKMFDNHIIYSVDAADLIRDGILAVPEFEPVETEYEVVPTIDERKYIEKYGEIDPSLVDKIARSSERNKVIIDYYMEHRERFGKTLIFALNIQHCITLREEFIKLGVLCDFVYSGIKDKKHNDKVIEQFRSGDLEVLLNINILTEGSDVPSIQTVFLTRPTSSESLLMQMIGRGLRGVGAGGTEKAYIVDFHDKWETFVKWLSPQFIMDGIIDDGDDDGADGEETEGKRRTYEYYPYSLIVDIYNSISYDYAGQPTYNTILPYGWFSAVDDEGNDITVLVTEAQLGGYSALEKDKEKLLHNKSLTGADLHKYFFGFVPQPLTNHLQAYLDDLRLDGNPPEIYMFDDRKPIDPFYVAQRIKDENLTYNQMEELMERVYSESTLAQKMFQDINAYKKRIMACLANKEAPIGVKVEELPIEKIPFDLTPHHDLVQLYHEVNEEMFGEYGDAGKISWTDKYYAEYFGMHHFTNGNIEINRILDSKDVPAEVIKYLIYHELLHRNYWWHDKEFREKEHLYPNYAEWDSFLDGQMLKFDTGGVKWEWKW